MAHRDRNAKRKRDEKESQGASASSKDALQTPKGFKKRDENVADQTAKDEGKQDPSRKIAWAPSFISLEPYESPLPTPPSKSRRTGTLVSKCLTGYFKCFYTKLLYHSQVISEVIRNSDCSVLAPGLSGGGTLLKAQQPSSAMCVSLAY